LGAILGVSLLTLLEYTPGANQFIAPAWSVGTFAWALGVAILLGLLGGIYPAWRASRLQPVEALRYE
jgi:putative ABC transport system permease protein